MTEYANLKGKHKFMLFYCVIFGRSCHLSCLKQLSGTLFYSENSLFIQLWKKWLIMIIISEFVLLPYLYCKYNNVELEFLLQNYSASLTIVIIACVDS